MLFFTKKKIDSEYQELTDLSIHSLSKKKPFNYLRKKGFNIQLIDY